MLVTAKILSLIIYDLFYLLLQEVNVSSLLQKVSYEVVLKAIAVLKNIGKHCHLFFWQGKNKSLLRNAQIFLELSFQLICQQTKICCSQSGEVIRRCSLRKVFLKIS